MGVLFRYSRPFVIPDIMSQLDVAERKIDSGAMGEVRDNHRILYN